MSAPSATSGLPAASAKPRTTSLFMALFNLTKSAVGLGTVLLVSKMQVLGLGWGISVIIAAAVIASISLHFLNRMSYNLDVGDFVRLAKIALGRPGEILAIVSILLVLLGSLIAYAYFIGTYAKSSISFFTGTEDAWYTSNRILTLLVVTLFVFPISCLKDLSKLAVTSIAGMGLMIAITGLVVYKSLTSDLVTDVAAVPTLVNPEFAVKIQTFSELASFPSLLSLGMSALSCLGSLIFAYMNHFTMVSLTQVLVRPTPQRRMILNIGATLLATAIYLTMAIFGYRYYRNAKVEDSLSVPQMTNIFAAAKLAVSVVLVFSYPLLAHPTRDALDSLFAVIAGDSTGFKSAVGLRHYSETAVCVFLPLLVAILAQGNSLGVLEISSAFFGSILVFVLPPVMFLKLKRKYITSPLERGLAYLLLTIGVIITLVGPIPPVMDIMGKLKFPEHIFSLKK